MPSACWSHCSSAGLEWPYAARSVQGLSTGLLLGASGAASVDLHPRRDGAQAGLVNGIASAAGIGIGADLSGLLVQFAPEPEVTPYAVVAVLAAGVAVTAWMLPETVTRSGRVTLTPRMPGVPRRLWRAFALSALGVTASWSVGGLYLSLGPGILSEILGDQNHAIGGLFVFAVCALAALSQVLLRDVATRPTVVGGATLLAVGGVITAGTIAIDSLAGFLAGSVLVGLGFGAAFMGALRSLAAQLPPAHRAGVMSAFFVVAYTAISVPAIGASVAAVHIGIGSAAAWFGRAIALLAAAVAIIGWNELRPAGEPD
jgi:MFS family permease